MKSEFVAPQVEVNYVYRACTICTSEIGVGGTGEADIQAPMSDFDFEF